MTRRTIVEHPDPLLRQRSEPIDTFDGELERLVTDLIDTLAATPGIAMSAPQIGVLQRVLVIDEAKKGSPDVYVNPELIRRAGLGLVRESCLSIPGVEGNVLRAPQVLVRAQDPTGATFERDVRGMHAVCLQHEIDHLEGKLFIDRLSPLRRWRIRRATAARLRKAGEQGADAA